MCPNKDAAVVRTLFCHGSYIRTTTTSTIQSLPLPTLQTTRPFLPARFRQTCCRIPPWGLHTPRIVSVRRLEIQNEVVENLRGPLTFHHNCQFQSWNQTAAKGVTPAHFREAVLLVIATLDRSYF